MISRDTAVHVAVLALAVGSLAVLAVVAPDGRGRVPRVVAFVAFNGLVLAGAHLYLAARGEAGMVPVASRWRFVGFVGVLLALGSLALLTDPVALGPVSSDAVLAGFAVLSAVVYLAAEALDGYRESTESTAR